MKENVELLVTDDEVVEFRSQDPCQYPLQKKKRSHIRTVPNLCMNPINLSMTPRQSFLIISD